MSDGTLVVNGNSYPVTYVWLPKTSSGGWLWKPTTTGTLTMSTGQSYLNQQVMLYQGKYYVWPNAAFSVATAPVSGGSTGGGSSSSPPATTGTSTSLGNLSGTQKAILAVVAVAAAVGGGLWYDKHRRSSGSVYRSRE